MSRDLPIYEIENALARELPRHRRVIVQAPTGSGKSTQIPQMLLDHDLAGVGQIVILQPRRLAARLLAARVARERGVELGREVGYHIRFENRSGDATRIRYVTEGILLRQMLGDPKLTGVAAILFDEFHERHLYGDITLARALDIQATLRPDIQILVMSATLDTALVEKYLQPCTVLTSEGRTFPVEQRYLADSLQGSPRDRIAEIPVWQAAADELERLIRQGVPGDALIFMPGAYEISRTVDALRQSDASRDMIILPLHGELAPTDQDAAVARYDRRKVVVSTNVAETSVTIDGVRIVIDSGLARIPRFDPYRGVNILLIERISRASADQRAGRAGRTAPGLCVRLWSLAEHQERALQEIPEIRRLDLAEVVLTLKASGVENVRGFRWLEPPESRSLDRAEQLLRDLGALDYHTGLITDVGRRMLAFPVHPRYSRMLLAAGELRCVPQAALIAALTQGRDLLVRRAGRDVNERRDDVLGEADSDFFILMRAWRFAEKNNFSLEACRRMGIHAQTARQVGPLVQQFIRIAREQRLPVDTPAPDDEAIQQCLLAGFSDHLARRLDSGTLRCEMIHGRRATLARESVVQKSELLVAADAREIGGHGGEVNLILSLASAVKPRWLQAMFPHDFEEKTIAVYDPVARRVFAERQRLFRDLVLETKRTDAPPADEAARLLATEVLKGNLKLPRWDEAVEQWLLRVNCLAAWCPELGLAIVTAEDRQHMIEQLCLGAVGYKDLKDRDVWPVVKGWLNPSQLGWVDKHCPERIGLPSGRTAKIVYAGETPPYISATIQNLFGLKESPRIAMGRISLTVHILAPSQRPVQVTQDLAGFWRDHYPRIKQELQRKYPKHEWR
jgi:ATP-dependent helicase HrpB